MNESRTRQPIIYTAYKTTISIRADVSKLLEEQSLVPILDARNCLAVEYYKDLMGAALPLECLSAQKPAGVKSFSLRVPLQMPAKLAAFLDEHPSWVKQLKTDMKKLQMEVDSSTGENLSA